MTDQTDQDVEAVFHHPDYARIAEVINQFVAEVAATVLTGGAGADTRTAGADTSALSEQALRQASSLLQCVGPATLVTYAHRVLSAAWMDGFMIGVRFQKAGGHIEVDESTFPVREMLPEE